MREFTFIVNPTAGKGAGARVFENLKSHIETLRHTVVHTTGPGHATEAAREAVSDVVVGVGGDGTLNEIANGLAGSTKCMGVIPAGSGNDFIKSVGISPKPQQALKTLLEGSTRAIDLGTVRCTESRDGAGNFPVRVFVNGVGIGFDAAVAARTREIPLLGGTALYVAAVLQTLGRYRAPEFALQFDSFTRQAPGLLVAVGNGTCAGGGFYLTPDASVDDGLLDVCAVDDKNIFEILRLMPKVMRGKHHDVPGVRFFKEKRLTVSADQQFYVHADGEIVGVNVRRAEIGIHTSKLNVIAESKS